MLGRLRDAVADVRDASSNATRWLGIDEAAAYMGSGNEKWRIVGARSAVAEEPELECSAAAVECSISGAVRGHAALQALEQFVGGYMNNNHMPQMISMVTPTLTLTLTLTRTRTRSRSRTRTRTLILTKP